MFEVQTLVAGAFVQHRPAGPAGRRGRKEADARHGGARGYEALAELVEKRLAAKRDDLILR
jgi:hypothetical protein